jgi:hypothetical protein
MMHAVTSALRRLRQEGHEFKTSLGYIARLCLKKVNGCKNNRIQFPPKTLEK